MEHRGSRAALTVIFILFGFMLATQFRARPPLGNDLQQQRAGELSVLLKVTEEERDVLKEEVKTLRARLAEMMAGENEVQVLQEELHKSMVLAGLTDVTGPGVSIEMTDSQKPASPGQDPNVYLIHDDDVQKLINELFGAGAEAVSVNGQRVVATTEVRCAGNVIMINGTRMAPPFKILAIGDPKTLEGGLKIRGGLVDSLKLWGIEIKIKMEEQVTIPAYGGSLNFRFAKPVTQGGEG